MLMNYIKMFFLCQLFVKPFLKFIKKSFYFSNGRVLGKEKNENL